MGDHKSLNEAHHYHRLLHPLLHLNAEATGLQPSLQRDALPEPPSNFPSLGWPPGGRLSLRSFVPGPYKNPIGFAARPGRTTLGRAVCSVQGRAGHI